MDRLPDDPAARRDWLERWAEQQQRALDDRPTPVTDRVCAGIRNGSRRLIAESARYAYRFLDRDLNTAGTTHDPEHDHPDRVAYVPTAWHVLPRALRTIGVSQNDTFVDFGCGKGRIVHQAARWRFRRVIGVEVSASLAEVARAGIAARRRQHRCRNVEIVVCDAAQFQVPDDLTVAYLFDPFRGDTLSAVLGHIVESIDRCPRRVRLVYVHPRHGAQVIATRRFRLLSEQRGGLRDLRVNRAAIFESV